MNVLYLRGTGGPGDVEDSDLSTWEDTLRDDSSEWDAGMDNELVMLTQKVRQHYEGLGYALQWTGSEMLTHTDPETRCRSFP